MRAKQRETAKPLETTVDDTVFGRLSKPIQKAILSKGFTTPTEPQAKAIPKILDGKNILLVAPTGTGKTEAAFLPILDMLYRLKEKPIGIKVLYVTPLRALNRDLLDRLEWWCKRLDVRLAVRHGDTETRERGRQALVPPDILITTPETLQAIIPGRVMQGHLKSVRWVVVDEVHELAGEKRGSQFTVALERLREITDHKFQTVGLSATIGTPRKVAEFLVGETGGPIDVLSVPVARYMNLEIVYPKAGKEDYELASKLYTYPDVAARLHVMSDLIYDASSVLIFTNTRTEAEALMNRFRIWNADFPIAVHHGSLSRATRIATEKALKEGKIEGIICTSSLELGIDIGHLDLVIQYNSPRDATRLIQRVGRSGHRIEAFPRGVIITQDSEDTLEAAVIARRALHEKLEPVEIPDSPLDTLTQQIAGLLLWKNRWRFQEALDIVRRAYPYRNLSVEDLKLVLRYMFERYPKLIWASFEEEIFSKPRDLTGLYEYYFGNLSMIPDERHYLVINDVDKTPIGVLDEAFVAEHGEVGTKFVEGGLVWKIRQVYRDKVYVEPEKNPLGAIPTWIGDEIPVPFEVASEVGAILGETEERMKKGEDLDMITADLAERYPAGKEVFHRALQEAAEQVKLGLPVPTDKRLTLERWGEFIILQSPAGHRINRAFARAIGHLLALEIGASVGVQQDPYRVVLKIKRVPLEQVELLLKRLSEKNLKSLVIDAAVKTGLFKRRFLHVAKKFGAVEKDADLTSANVESLIEGLRGTAIFKEAVKTVLREDLDVEGLSTLAKRIASGELEIAVLGDVEEPSPISRIGLEEISRKSDIVPPARMRQILLKSTRARLLNEVFTVVCTDCWDYVESRKVVEMQEISCPECGSQKIGFTTDSEEDVRRLSESMRVGGEPPKRFRRMAGRITGSAELYQERGFPAVVVLAGRGIRPSDASEILKHDKIITEEMIERILEGEKRALKRRYSG